MPIKLIASDMDGTFLTANDMYNQARFERVLSEMTKRDMKFVAASGRQVKICNNFLPRPLPKGMH